MTLTRKLPRTWLFGPGADTTAHAAMAQCGAHALILDLEDSTPAPLRAQARALLPAAFTRWRDVDATVCVRINTLDTEGLADLQAVMPARPDVIAYPKAQHAPDMQALDECLARHEQALGLAVGSTQILPVCETALGVLSVRSLAAASTRIRFALLGTEDLAADLMAPRSRAGTELEHARRHFVLECRAAGIEPIDAPWTYGDAQGAATEAHHARQLGYRCKSLVLPQHASAILDALRPDATQIDEARHMVQAFEAARARGEDRAVVNGLWVEVPTYLNARRLLDNAD